jgi:hypothetical protein
VGLLEAIRPRSGRFGTVARPVFGHVVADQWLASLAHSDAGMGKWVDVFGELAKELHAWSLAGYGASSR